MSNPEERPVRALRFSGFGLGWPWPLINILLEIRGTAGVRSLRGRGGSLAPTMANTEVWNWVDYRGRKRELVVRREVKEA